MKSRSFLRRIRAGLLAAAVIVSSIPFSANLAVYAEEVAAEGEVPAEVPAEGAEGEVAVDPAAEGGELTDPNLAVDMGDMSQGTGVTPGTILANNGLYIANTFPDSLMPSGFYRKTVAYQGQNIDLAYMNNSDMVSLAYLTDVTGTVGDFYLCDTSTATMSDYVRLEGGNGAYLIVLDPGDNINPPAGFKKAVLNIDNKSVTAWTLPTGSSSDDEESSEEEADVQGLLRVTETVYAGDLGLGIGAGSSDGSGTDPAAADPGATVVDNSYADGTTVDGTYTDPAAGTTDAGSVDMSAEAAAEVAAANVVTDAAGFVKPQPSEYFLIYGIDYNGAQGFFLYDTLGRTYQRYVEIDTGESETTAKYRKSAQIRLFIIAGLILFAVVLIFIIVNMSLNGKRGGRNIDDEDDVEEMKKRVRKKEYSSIKKNGGRRYIQNEEGFEDDEDVNDRGSYGRKGGYGYNNAGARDDMDEEEEDIRYYDRGSSHTGRGVQRNAPGREGDRNQAVRSGVRTQPRSNIRTQQRPGVRTEARPGVRTERRYPVQEDPSQYQADGMQDNGDWNSMDNMMSDDMGGGNMNTGYGQGQGQDIDLDDDFNFDFIKPGK